MTKQSFAIARAFGVIGATVAMVAGVTFANLTSNSVTLTSNTLASATAALQIKSGGGFDVTDTGFNFIGLLPGNTSAPFTFILKNTGTADLDVTMATPALSTTGGLSLAQVTFTFTPVGGGAAQVITGDVLSTSSVLLNGGPLAAGTTKNYTVTAKISSAYSGSGATVNPFTLTFTGTQTTPPLAS